MEDLLFDVKLTWLKMSQDYVQVIPTTGMLYISAPKIDSFPNLESFRKHDKGMDINPEQNTLYRTQYQQVFLKYAENE